jgi:hypothetical protein
MGESRNIYMLLVRKLKGTENLVIYHRRYVVSVLMSSLNNQIKRNPSYSKHRKEITNNIQSFPVILLSRVLKVISRIFPGTLHIWYKFDGRKNGTSQQLVGRCVWQSRGRCSRSSVYETKCKWVGMQLNQHVPEGKENVYSPSTRNRLMNWHFILKLEYTHIHTQTRTACSASGSRSFGRCQHSTDSTCLITYCLHGYWPTRLLHWPIT